MHTQTGKPASFDAGFLLYCLYCVVFSTLVGGVLRGDITGLTVVLDGIPAIFQAEGLDCGSLLEIAQLLAFRRCLVAYIQVRSGVNNRRLCGSRLGGGYIFSGNITGLAFIGNLVPAVLRAGGLNRGSLFENAELLAVLGRLCANMQIARGVNGLGGRLIIKIKIGRIL